MTRARDLAAFVSNADGDIKFDTDTLFIDSSANRVGIGETAPERPLHIKSADNIIGLIESTDADAWLAFQDDTSASNNAVRVGATGDNLRFYAGAAERMRIDDSGNVGIGTDSPTQSLEVDGAILIKDSSTVGTLNLTNTSVGIKRSNAVDTANSRDIEVFTDGSGANVVFSTNGAGSGEVTIDDSGNVGIGTSSPAYNLSVEDTGSASIGIKAGTSSTARIRFGDSSDDDIGQIYYDNGADSMRFLTNSNEQARINSNGDIFIGKTAADNTTDGIRLAGSADYVSIVRNGEAPLILNRRTTDGDIILFRQDNATVGRIGTVSGDQFYFAADDGAGIKIDSDNSMGCGPCNASGSDLDNSIDLGRSGNRWDDVYATNGTIQTSDEREKQQIASLTDAEITAAKAISKLFKTFKWNDSVEENGDNARTHAGVIAQQVETAMSDAGLDASNYAFFINTTWWETQTEVAAVEAVEAQDAVYEDVVIPAVEEVLDDDGNIVTEAQPERTEQRLVTEAVEPVEAKDAYTHIMSYYTLEEAPEGATERNRKGIRYPELLSFIGAATEQRLTSIEARLDALEA